MRESYKDIFTELLLADDTRVGFHKQDNGLLVWQGAYLTHSAETLLPWRAVANVLNDLIEQHELIAAIDPKKLPQAEEQLSFELPDGSPPSAEDDRLEKDDFLTPEKQESVIRSVLPVADYNAPQMDDGSVITDEEINLALAAGSNFENSKFRIYQQFTTTQGDHAAFLKKEYGSGGRSWDYQSGAHGWVDHGPAGLKLILTNDEGRFERRLPWRAAAKRIAYLIEIQRFLTPQELEQYPAWAAAQREAANVVRDEPGNVPDTRPVCAEGSVVYLEDDHRFTVERIGQFDVHLRDEEFPLVGRAISREEFQRQLDANPRNIPLTATESLSLAMKMPVTAENNYNRNKNVIVFGPSGSGKSYSVAGPQLLQFNSNYVLSDPKGELLDTYGNVLVSQGYDVKVFNLKDRDKSDHYNPFAYIHDTDDIVVVAKNLIKNMKEDPRQKNTADPIWEEGSTSLLEALLAYVYFEQPPEMHNMNSVMELFVLMQHRYGPQGRSQLDDIFEDLAMEKPASFAARQYGLYHMAPDKTAQSIDVSLGMRMSAFNIPSIMKICEDDTIHLEELASDKKVALFVVTPDTTTAYNFLAAVMFQQCFQILVHTADNREAHCLPRHVRFLLDEFPNIGMIPEGHKPFDYERRAENDFARFIDTVQEINTIELDEDESDS